MKKRLLSIILAAAILLSFTLAVNAADNSGGNVQVEPVTLPEIEVNGGEFIKGVDVSSYFSLKNSGVVYRDFEGNALSDSEFFTFLKSCGVNYIRVRIWNDPYDENGNGYGGGNCDLDNAIYLGKLAANAGMKLLADFHLSDFWCDPSYQRAPKAWSSYSLSQKEEAVYSFVYSSLAQLENQGVNVGMVQIGNEINSGLCGETSQDSIARLVKSGTRAVFDVDKSVLRAVHYTNPEKGAFGWFAENLENNNVDYDVFASSYYPYWHGSMKNFTSELKNISDAYGKYVMCAETAYPFTDRDSDFFGNNVNGGEDTLEYPVSVQGQAAALRDVFQSVADVGSKAIGVFYWEPGWITVGTESYYDNLEKWEKHGSGWESSYAAGYCDDNAQYHGGSSWDNQALFDKNGNPLSSLLTFKLIGESTPPATEPTTVPTAEPATELTTEPTTVPTTEPSTEPTTEPAAEPPLTKIPCDVNGDKEYNIKDAAAIQLQLAKLYTGYYDESVADMNGDGEVNIKDAAYIQLDLAKLL